MANNLFTGSGGKLLTFMLGKQEYGLQILEAREVVGMIPIEPVPQTPAFLKGVINLRGKIIPVINLRTRFKMDEIEKTSDSCIVVVDMDGQTTGVIVDALSGVVTIGQTEYEDSPQLGHHIKNEFIMGMAKLENRVIVILSIEHILSTDELEIIKTDAAGEPAA